MDPDEVLKRIRSLASDIVRSVDRDRTMCDIPLTETEEAASDMCDAFIALDEWLSDGGFKPTSWNK